MNTLFRRISLLLLGTILLASCAPEVRVGALQSESQSVELKDARSAQVEIAFGAGDLELAGGAQKLLEAGFTYNVAELKPEVKQTGDTLIIRQPSSEGLPDLRNITDFRNEWDLKLNDGIPMDLRIDVGGGTSDLRLAGLSLTRLEVNLGAGDITIDLSGDWERDLDVTIDAGAANLSIRLPSDVGVRVEVDAGPTIINAPDLNKAGNVYTNAAYGASEVTLQVYMSTGIGWLNLEVEETEATVTSE